MSQPRRSEADAAHIAGALAAWFGRQHRAMPWRETRDPYRIWLSEIMLQQTQVQTVLPYYRRFLARWPTVTALAEAPISEVIKVWEGLGYYARCRNLHRAATEMVARHGGRFPDTMKAAMALPGVGRSTAGAILTFGHGQRWPLLDGNVRRVLTRLYDIDELPTKSAVQRRLWAHSEALLAAAGDAWTHNQAIMELGATVCTPKNPDCPECPARPLCAAEKAGTQAQRPVKRQAKPIPHHHIAVAVISDAQGRVLIQLRPPSGLLGGLWEFPGGKQEPGEALAETARRECQEELGVDIVVGEPITRVRHAYSHFKITLHAFHARITAGRPAPRVATELRWVSHAALDGYAFPKANRRVLDALLA